MHASVNGCVVWIGFLSLGDRHPETGRVLCALAQVYKRMCNFERAARYDRLWRLCPPLPKQPKGSRLAAVAASNAAAADTFYPHAAAAGTEAEAEAEEEARRREQHSAAPPVSLFSQKLHPDQRRDELQRQLQHQKQREQEQWQQQRQYSTRPASPTGSVVRLRRCEGTLELFLFFLGGGERKEKNLKAPMYIGGRRSKPAKAYEMILEMTSNHHLHVCRRRCVVSVLCATTSRRRSWRIRCWVGESRPSELTLGVDP